MPKPKPKPSVSSLLCKAQFIVKCSIDKRPKKPNLKHQQNKKCFKNYSQNKSKAKLMQKKGLAFL